MLLPRRLLPIAALVRYGSRDRPVLARSPGGGHGLPPAPGTCAGGRSAHEVGERDVEGVGEEEQVAVPRVVEAAFDPLDGGAVNSTSGGQLLLCEVPV